MKLHYKKYGTGPPLFILHGMFGMGDNWRTIAKKLERRFQCILVDLRNHGRSPHDPVMNFGVMTEDILDLMIDLGIEKSSFLGHSLGGKVAMQITLQHPERVEKLIVVDIAPKAYPLLHDKIFEAISSFHPSAIQNRTEAEESLTRILGDSPSVIQFLLKNLDRLPEGGYAWKANMPVIMQSYEDLMELLHDSKPFLGEVLFVRGGYSDYIRDEDMVQIRQLFPAAELITLPLAGHWVHADAPVEFTREILTFLEGQ